MATKSRKGKAKEPKTDNLALAQQLVMSILDEHVYPRAQAKEPTEAELIVKQLALEILPGSESSSEVFRSFAKMEPVKDFVRSSDPLSYYLTDGTKESSDSALDTVPVRADMLQMPLATKASLVFEMDSFHSSMRLSQFDREVFDAAVSIYHTIADQPFTPQMIYDLLQGKSHGSSASRREASAQMIQRIDETLQACMKGLLYIELSPRTTAAGEAERRVSGTLLPLYRSEVVLHGKSRDTSSSMVVYRFNATPILYPLLLKLGSYLTTPLVFNALPDNCSFTVHNIATRSYIIDQLVYAHADGKKEAYAALDKIYELRSATSSTQKSRAKQFVISLLDEWQSRGYITHYDLDILEKKRRVVRGVIIGLQESLFAAAAR